MDSAPGEDLAGYARLLGLRLRSIREQKRYTLHEVQALSKGEFKAAALGAYERGTRNIPLHRLQRLAVVYEVPVDQLLPRQRYLPGGPVTDGRPATGAGWHQDRSLASGQPLPARPALAWHESGKVTIDLTKLGKVTGPERDMLSKFLNMIQVQRQDFNGRMITIREPDLRAIAALFGVTPVAMLRRLDELELRVAA